MAAMESIFAMCNIKLHKGLKGKKIKRENNNSSATIVL